MKNPEFPYRFWTTLFGLFAVVRGYNIALLFCAAPHFPLCFGNPFTLTDSYV